MTFAFIYHMLEWEVFPLIAFAFLELVAHLVTFATSFWRSASARGAFSTSATVALGGCTFEIFQACFVLFSYAITVFSQPLSIYEIFHGLVKKIV